MKKSMPKMMRGLFSAPVSILLLSNFLVGCGGSSEQSQTDTPVNTPVDKTAPTIAGLSNLTVNLGDEINLLAGISAADNIDGDLSGEIIITGEVNVNTLGVYSLIYTVTDNAGNTRIRRRDVEVVDVNVVDIVPPVISGANNIILAQRATFNFLDGITASDNVDGDITNALQATGSFDITIEGLYQLTYQVSDQAGNTTVITREINVIAVDLPEVSTEPVFAQYFDIASGSDAGSEVTGKINLKRNRLAKTEAIPDDYKFVVINDGSYGIFELFTERDDDGRLFGRFQVASGETAQQGDYPLTVELRENDTVLARFPANIKVAAQTQWQTFYYKVQDFIKGNNRLTGRKKYTDDEAWAFITELEINSGVFTDLSFYQATTIEQWAAIGIYVLGADLAEANVRIGGLAKVYRDSSNFSVSQPENRKQLRQVIYAAMLAYIEHFPTENFASSSVLAYNDFTHQWRFTDGLSGGAAIIFQDLLADIALDNAQAKLVKSELFELLQNITFDIPYAWRFPSEIRYYLPEALNKSTGAFGDANRHHRMRTWLMMGVIWHDYNRPLTEQPWWYDDYQPFAASNTTVLPEWQPQGSFTDLQVWLVTNARFPQKYGQSGLMPDGTISHHVGSRQDTALWAYGFEWMVSTFSQSVKLFADSPWQIDDLALNQTVDFLLFIYPKLIYKNGIDFQSVGRSHYSKDVGRFGTKQFVGAVDKLNAAKSTNTTLVRDDELQNTRQLMADGTHQYSGNTAFWVNDYMVHRREDAQANYFMSVKMQSGRTRGAESFSGSSENGFHNGSGVLQVKVDGKEYQDSRYVWDWHALPGLTEELRTDALPLQSTLNLFNPNLLAGTASNGKHGLAAFQYASENPYTSAEANKGYFFINDHVLALGSKVKRVRNTDGSDNESIITTLDQAAWDSDIHYRLNDATEDTVVTHGSAVNSTMAITENSWFYQDGIGYVILPTDTVMAHLATGSEVVDSNLSDTKAVEVFRLAIDHGDTPTGNGQTGQYAYILVPNVTAADMPQVVADISNNYQLINTELVQGHHYNDGSDDVIQLAFYAGGTATFDNGVTVSVDKAALVQLQKSGDNWDVTVSDPTHHVDEIAQNEVDYFQFKNLSTANQIGLTTNLTLMPGEYSYLTQGNKQDFVSGQTVELTCLPNDNCLLLFNLPDELDKVAYDYRQQLYTGMPANVIIPQQ